MDTVSKRRRFLINLLYWVAILAIVYLCFRYLLKLLMPFVIALLVAWLLRPICRWYGKKNLHGQLYTALVVATVLIFYLIIGGLITLILINVGANIAQRLSGLPAASVSVLPDSNLSLRYGKMKNVPHIYPQKGKNRNRK